MPNRRSELDYVGILKRANIPEEKISIIMKKLASVEGSLEDEQISLVVRAIAKDAHLRENFIVNPTKAVKDIIARFPPVP